MNKYKLILFDLDGTLCNTDEMVVQTFLKLYEQYEPKVRRTREQLYYFSGPPLKKTMEEEFPLYDSETMVKAFQNYSKTFYETTVHEYEGELEALASLKKAGYLLGIVTNKYRVMLSYSLKLCHIENMFDVIVSSEDVTLPKPAPDGIYQALKLLGITNKKDVIYVGDNDIDYHTANNAGIDAMLVSWGPRQLKCLNKAKYQVASYAQLEEIFL